MRDDEQEGGSKTKIVRGLGISTAPEDSGGVAYICIARLIDGASLRYQVLDAARLSHSLSRCSDSSLVHCTLGTMSKPDIVPKTTVSGISVDPRTLERVIPQSRRQDGTYVTFPPCVVCRQ